MPFIPQSNRKKISEGNPAESVGDLCYIEYKRLMEAWKKERRWQTAHDQFKRVFKIEGDAYAARVLAYLVWFNEHVMLYEWEKQNENGDIE